jgi:acyl carrier protein
MNDRRTRLLQCFSLVFPQLSSAQLEAATVNSVANWDSVATVTLIAMIEEEFGCTVELEEYEQLTSFAACLRLVES